MVKIGCSRTPCPTIKPSAKSTTSRMVRRECLLWVICKSASFKSTANFLRWITVVRTPVPLWPTDCWKAKRFIAESIIGNSGSTTANASMKPARTRTRGVFRFAFRDWICKSIWKPNENQLCQIAQPFYKIATKYWPYVHFGLAWTLHFAPLKIAVSLAM